MAELEEVLNEMAGCGKQMMDLAEELKQILADHKPEQKPVTLEDVRTALAQKSLAGHTEEVRCLIRNHGADKLSSVDPKEYASLLAEVNQLP